MPGEGFNAGRLTKELSAPAAVEAFYTGRLADPRLFLSVTSLHDELRRCAIRDEALPVPFPGLTGVRAWLSTTPPPTTLPLPALRTASAVEWYQHTVPDDPEVVVSARVEEQAETSSSHLCHSIRLTVQPTNGAGDPVGEEFGADAIVRVNDTLLLVALARCGNEIFIPVNLGARAPLDIRDRPPRVIHTVTGARNLEGVSGVLDVPCDDQARATDRVRAIVRASTGHDCVGEPLLTPIAGYLSPEFNTSGFRLAVACVELDETSPHRLPPSSVLADPRALLDAGVRDLSLRLTARIACDIVERDRSPRADILTPPERAEFHRLLLSDSSVWRFIREHSPRLRELMHDKPVLVSLLNKRVNDGELEIERRTTDDPEHFFFNSLMQGFTVRHGEHPLRVAQLLWHDVWHYEHADPLPFTRDESGILVPGDLGAYAAGVTTNEIDGVMFSDVILVELYGVDDFERELGYGSLAGLLQAAGITDLDERRAVVARAHEEGVLDPRLVRCRREPAERAYYDDVVREKLLGIYARDTLRTSPACTPPGPRCPESRRSLPR